MKKPVPNVFFSDDTKKASKLKKLKQKLKKLLRIKK